MTGTIPLTMAPAHPTAKTVKTDARILFTTAYYAKGAVYDFYAEHTVNHLSCPSTIHPGLRFIKQNIPQIEILEFPTWEEFTQVLRQGWDVVGFSFYTREGNEILRMAEFARKAGVPELWAGNYGALNPLLESTFDRIYLGYAEKDLARDIGARLPQVLVHPPLIETVSVAPNGSPNVSTATLYTARGCPLKCTFCQAPNFAPDVSGIPLESIERVLRYYKKHGAEWIFIHDETFGISPVHTQGVVALLRKYDLLWSAMTRADILRANIDEWYESGMIGAFMGIETVSNDVLQRVKKKEKIEGIIEGFELLRRRSCFGVGFYIIGFEEDTVASIERDYAQITKFKPDFVGVSLLTPYPKTPLWAEIEHKHGIDTSDWSKFNQAHMVWNHPEMTRDEAVAIRTRGYQLFNTGANRPRFAQKMVRRFRERRGPTEVHSFVAQMVHRAMHGITKAEPAEYLPLQ
jgi:radical SAM superfamily enzyme YgiQ (UPF0313 family)